MWMSDERIRHISHLIVDALYYDDLIDYDSEESVVTEVKRIALDYFHKEDKIDSIVRDKISSLSRPVPPGSREWDILYKKYFDEESRKRGI
jgi:hypothetical protein